MDSRGRSGRHLASNAVLARQYVLKLLERLIDAETTRTTGASAQ